MNHRLFQKRDELFSTLISLCMLWQQQWLNGGESREEIRKMHSCEKILQAWVTFWRLEWFIWACRQCDFYQWTSRLPMLCSKLPLGLPLDLPTEFPNIALSRWPSIWQTHTSNVITTSTFHASVHCNRIFAEAFMLLEITEWVTFLLQSS